MFWKTHPNEHCIEKSTKRTKSKKGVYWSFWMFLPEHRTKRMQTEEEKAGQQRLFNTGAVITSSPLVSWPPFFCVCYKLDNILICQKKRDCVANFVQVHPTVLLVIYLVLQQKEVLWYNQRPLLSFLRVFPLRSFLWNQLQHLRELLRKLRIKVILSLLPT